MTSEGDSNGLHVLRLPDAPASERGPVKAWHAPVTMFTFMPEQPDPNPMFLEKRVYQGSSGRVYPLPFIDRVATEGKDHSWQAVHLENEYLRLMIMPEIGGRIHVGLDKINGYDFFYRQNVIKPALVGLAGPWISGGVEFNWPQHHRPATFMPVEVEIEREADGSITVWCSDHDPMERMKGMHGICLHPGSACLELKVRLYNRTQFVKTFLWWANVATRVHEHYQSFFPTDVHYVADHAKRAVSRFPQSDGLYYGVDYAERSRTGVPEEEQPRLYVPNGSYPANDLSWYANIPVPTSYMIVGTYEDFFGGYDHAAKAGVVHVANHHIAPGKKQWTWGNHDFGYAWNRSLTDHDGPYIELMAGVYTDNQPDFSFIAPGETKMFSQFWYPIRQIGVPQAVTLDAALSLRVTAQTVHIGVCVSRDLPETRIRLSNGEEVLTEWVRAITVADPAHLEWPLSPTIQSHDLRVSVEAGGHEILRYTSRLADTPSLPPAVATEPPPPEAIATTEELYLTGLHLQQYRHATREPQGYWREALRRDSGDSRTNHAMGLWHLRRGEFVLAEMHIRRVAERLTRLNPNPYDGEVFYSLGQVLRFQHKDQEAYAAFYKATWNAAWRAPAHHALAELDAKRGDWETAVTHLRSGLRLNMDDLNARNLASRLLAGLGRSDEAQGLLAETSRLDPLDIWGRFLESGEPPVNNQLRLDLSLDHARAGLWDDAMSILTSADSTVVDGSSPMVLYTLAWLHMQQGNEQAAGEALVKAAQAPHQYCFPSRLEEIEILEMAIQRNPLDARAPYYLGNLLYDRTRYGDAVTLWERSALQDPAFATVWRNLGFAYFNALGEHQKARDAFNRAQAANPQDARVLYERDQLWKRIGEGPEVRLAELKRHPDLLNTRDDLSAELATLYNQIGEPERALEVLSSRKFQPWEGGEGLVSGQWVRTHLLLGQRSLEAGDVDKAISYFQAALAVPGNLGEAKHLLANQSEIFYWMGVACCQMNNADEAGKWWEKAARQRGDFQQMSIQPVSEMSYWSALALVRLEKRSQAKELFQTIASYARELESQEPKIDYFATSLPAMLLFNEDIAQRKLITATFLRAQAMLGLGHLDEATKLLQTVLRLDSNHAGAEDLLNLAANASDSSRRSDACTPSLPL